MTDLVQFVYDIFGEYEPLYDNNNNVIGGVAGLNYPWLVSAFLFCAGFIGIICLGRTVIRCLFGKA